MDKVDHANLTPMHGIGVTLRRSSLGSQHLNINSYEYNCAPYIVFFDTWKSRVTSIRYMGGSEECAKEYLDDFTIESAIGCWADMGLPFGFMGINLEGVVYISTRGWDEPPDLMRIPEGIPFTDTLRFKLYRDNWYVRKLR